MDFSRLLYIYFIVAIYLDPGNVVALKHNSSVL